jgi:hypothetical protein
MSRFREYWYQRGGYTHRRAISPIIDLRKLPPFG